MFVLYRTPSVAKSEGLHSYYAAALAADVLAGDEFGVLYDELVRKQRVATRVSASYNAKELSSGAVSIDINLAPGVSPDIASNEVKRVIEQLVSSGVSKKFVENAKYRGMARVVYGLDGIEDRAWFYAGLLAIGSPAISMEDVVDAIKSIRVEDVNAAIKGIFTNPAVEGHFVVLFGTECIAADGVTVDVRSANTPNGIRYWYLKEHNLPIVSVAIAFKKAGSAYDPEGQHGLSYLASLVMPHSEVEEGASALKKLTERG
ncbi:hypothetical protein GH714_042908 [Hevea brasiliensis]|uniref:Peptidase M16 C-terminal domain-containing protein n=1 Tax=Hevea brasiliensis TaxID=3981 RepID=A0A6A6K0R2_HEVBR|nr:hypothetical protein GH714_042908 [Hevea brasiliensis]